MPKRLAITIAGAVSLGSFEAGVLYEVLAAIKQHNENPATTADQRIEIDVLTGASAGGMTATIAAQKLLFEAAALDGPYQNSLYRPWVVEVDLDGLLALQPGEDPSHSILSSNFVESISQKYLTQRYQSHISPTITTHAAAARTIHLGLALSNLNGVNYSKSTYPSGSFNYTRYQDQILHKIEPRAEYDDEDLWEALRNAAVSCGAFPFAFRVKELFRHKSEYPEADPKTFGSEVETFTYTDGGVFQNEPLGMAKNFVDDIDQHLNVDSRYYLFVSPGIRSATADPAFNQLSANYKGTGVELAKSVFQQARFQDWITAETVNAQVVLFNQRSRGLMKAIQDNKVSVDSLKTVSDQLLPLFFDPNDAKAQQTQRDAQTRLKQQFAPEYSALGANADTWIKSILVFETAADLGERDEMYICAITADDSELASSGVDAFLGFFDQTYRDHDYDVGRTKAQEFLKTPPGTLGPINWQPDEPIRDINHELDGLQLQDVDEDKRRQFKSRLQNRAHAVLEELGVPTAIIREAIDLAFISPQLDKLLKL